MSSLNEIAERDRKRRVSRLSQINPKDLEEKNEKDRVVRHNLFLERMKSFTDEDFYHEFYYTTKWMGLKKIYHSEKSDFLIDSDLIPDRVKPFIRNLEDYFIDKVYRISDKYKNSKLHPRE